MEDSSVRGGFSVLSYNMSGLHLFNADIYIHLYKGQKLFPLFITLYDIVRLLYVPNLHYKFFILKSI